MKRRFVLALAILAMLLMGFSSQQASAQGFHFQSRGVHLDVGYPHYGGFYGGYGGSYNTYYGGSQWGHGHYGGGHWNNDHVWHDTTHLDYHPGEFVPHYNHYHYVPGHYDVHRTGHWDHLHD